MYTNIRTGPVIHCIGRFDLKNEKHLAVTPAVLMDAYKILMKNNIFQFGDTYRLQNIGSSDGKATSAPLGYDFIWYS